MNSNLNEQAEVSATDAKAAESENLAGFADAEALVAAYKSLQAEFTRRSQRLKAAEKQLDGMKNTVAMEILEGEKKISKKEDNTMGNDSKNTQNEIETDFENFLKQFPEADAQKAVEGAISSADYKKGGFTRAYVRSLREKISSLEQQANNDEVIISKALASGKVTDAIVKEYLKAVASNQPTNRPVFSSASPSLPPSKPKSIIEAGALAGDIFKNND